jgi:glucosamine 6-phosphate synthetase-like amidotransferase/phosphosugar isomerase protein
MVQVSISLDDLDLIAKALDSADFYYNSTPEDEKKFYDHISELRYRLERHLKKWNKIKEIDEKIKWNKQVFHLGRGFHTFDEFMEAQNKLLDERRSCIRVVSE